MGPFDCQKQFEYYGYSMGCETWKKNSGNDFPHFSATTHWKYGSTYWGYLNVYPGATWYSLPGPCPSEKIGHKSAECVAREPGGACPAGVAPTGEWNCTYTYEKVGEISINDLEGITDPEEFVRDGGEEYVRSKDAGVHNSFWNDIHDKAACQKRIDHAEALFKEKYPSLPDYPDPPCDFNKYTFFKPLGEHV